MKNVVAVKPVLLCHYAVKDAAVATTVTTDDLWLARYKDSFGAAADIATPLTLIVGVIVAIQGWKKLKLDLRVYADQRIDIDADRLAESKKQSCTEARNKFETYIMLAMNKPQYMLAYWLRQDITDAEREQYRWFVKYILWTCEGIMLAFPDDPEWPVVVREHIGYHLPYLSSDKFDEFDTYETPLRDLLRDAVNSASSNSA